MSSIHDARHTAAPAPPAPAGVDDWVPEDRAPSDAENNFMSFALFAFLILFGLGCMILL
ncbi:hypothetical protein [Ornithinimicrobium panacihumi]|uniref:hypothetical protein n=1 Tax=Ornithinimicrobium panacihumi TaxID=2008449 RepID=UPI003F8BC2B9